MNPAPARMKGLITTVLSAAFVISLALPALAQTAPLPPGVSNRLGDFVGQDAQDPTARADLTRLQTVTAGATLALTPPQSGNITYDVTTSAALALSFAGGQPGKAEVMTVIIRQPAGGGFAVTLPAASATMVWNGGAAPTVSTTAGSVTVFRVLFANGTYLGGF